MTNTPAGWHPDPSGAPQQRWWDGSQWTEHVSAPYGETVAAPSPTATNTVWGWLFAAVPVITLINVVSFDMTSYVEASLHPDPTNPLAIFTPGYFLLQGLGLLVYALSVVFAALDHRELKKRGVVRPFHWAWSFLSSIVYIIGRTVVIRRRTGGGGAGPLWLYIALFVVAFVVSFAKGIAAVNYIMQTLPQLSGS